MDAKSADGLQNLFNEFIGEVEFGAMENFTIIGNYLIIEYRNYLSIKIEYRIFKGEESLSLSVASNADTNTLVSMTA